jgi:hypothetical protein
VSGNSLVVTAKNQTVLPQIQICVYDISGNPTTAISNTQTGVTSNTGNLTGVLTSTIASGSTCATFSSITFQSPASGIYQLIFASSPLSNAALSITITEGDPFSMQFLTLPSFDYSNSGVLSRQPVLQLADILGNPVGRYSNQYQVVISVNPLNNSGPAITLIGNRVSPVNGMATFQKFSFQGQHGQYYQLAFTVTGSTSTSPLLTSTIYITPCDEIASLPYTVVSSDYYTCLCTAGYEPSSEGVCQQCLQDYYKTFPSNEPCAPCEGVTETIGTGATNCVCKQGN